MKRELWKKTTIERSVKGTKRLGRLQTDTFQQLLPRLNVASCTSYQSSSDYFFQKLSPSSSDFIQIIGLEQRRMLSLQLALEASFATWMAKVMANGEV